MPNEEHDRLDLDEFARTHNLRITIRSIDDPSERKFQRAQRQQETKLQRTKEAVLFGVAVLLVVAICGLCFWALATDFPSDDKKWAASTLTLITGALVGYLTGSFRRGRPQPG